MRACYDLATNPPTYDVCTFLGYIEKERIKNQHEAISLHILPGPHQGFRRDSLWPHSIEKRKALLRDVVVPMCNLLPSVHTLTVEPLRTPQFNGYYGNMARFISLPNFLKVMSWGIRPLRYPTECEKSSKLVTITLREAEHHPLRNSQVAEWLKAAKAIEKRGYDVVFIRDTEKCNEVLGDVNSSQNASEDLMHRARWYSSAVMNLGINNGPMWMAILMDVPVLMLRPTTNKLGGCYDDSFFKHCGLPPGSQLPTSPPYQRIAWLDDTETNIVQSFDEVMSICQNG